jgi:hypothetical protein
LARRTAHGVHEATAGDRQPEAFTQQRGDLPERQTQLFGQRMLSTLSCTS